MPEMRLASSIFFGRTHNVHTTVTTSFLLQRSSLHQIESSPFVPLTHLDRSVNPSLPSITVAPALYGEQYPRTNMMNTHCSEIRATSEVSFLIQLGYAKMCCSSSRQHSGTSPAD
jgi:hypothetical protein